MKPEPRANILILEDFESWQKKFKRFLKDEPFNVMVAANHKQAETLFEQYPFDLLVVDVNLSGVPYNVDGLQLAEKFWRRNPDIKMVIVTGSQEWDRRLNRYGFKPSFVLEKQSLDQDDFVAKIYQALSLAP